MNILPRSFYSRDTAIVAQELLGKLLVHTLDGVTKSGYIVETEAYTGDDPACHAYRGKTERTAPLFGQVGCTYVYFIYGNHYCLNVVSRHKAMISGGVLIRALEPVAGIEHMGKLRTTEKIHNLTNGPGKLTQALGITKKDIGIDVTQQGSLYIAQGRMVAPNEIIAGPRIGLSVGVETPWRFYCANNAWVSKNR